MAVSELLAFSVLLLALKFTISTTTDEPWLQNDVASSPVPSDSSFVALESSIGERNQEFVERSENVGVGEIELIQEFSSDVEHVGTPKKDVGELEKQVERLMKEIEMHNMNRNRLGARANYVEQRIHSLSSKLEQLYKVNDEQDNRIRKFESLLQVAEVELVKVEEETALRPRNLSQEELIKGEEEEISLNSADLNQGKPVTVKEETALHCKGLNQSTHGDWLPGWLYAHFDHIQLSLTSYWNESQKIVMDLSIQKGLKTKARVEDWIKLQTEMIKADWFSIMKEQWLGFVACLQSYVRSLTTNLINICFSSMDYISPHASKLHKHSLSFAQEWIPILKEQITESATHLIRYIRLLTATIMDIVCASWSFIAPHAQKAKSFAESYVLQSGISLRYLLKKLYFTMGSRAIQVLDSYGRLLNTTLLYHRQVQEWLKHHFD